MKKAQRQKEKKNEIVKVDERRGIEANKLNANRNDNKKSTLAHTIPMQGEEKKHRENSRQ